TTPIYLKATAGMRLVPEPEGGRIMAEVRRYLAASPFDLESAEIISGQQEALFGWITVNYMLGLLGDGGPFPTVGALDLGGASTQITFLPLDYPEESAARVVLGGTEYRVYSHSYLGLGQDQALQAVGSPTCYPKGYPIPSGTAGVADGSRGLGDYQACRQAIRDTLSADCTASDCSLMGVYQPPLYGDFFAFSGYGYAASFFGLGQDLSLAALEASGQTYCAEDWEQILRQRPDERGRKYLPAYCFKAAYIVTLLTDGFGFPLTTRRIVTPGRVQGSEVSWVLGSLVYELGGSTH
ncbi:MAG: hypothetical protein O7A04_07575, partial [Acidobacteria bacterium]|nr:hypothetical protein [Acidobacteriota bacterium]